MNIKTMLAACALAAVPSIIQAQLPSILPAPAECKQLEGSLALPSKIEITGQYAAEAARCLDMRGVNADIAVAKGIMSAYSDPAIPAEGYRLKVWPKGIELGASDAAGIMYGVETLTQMIDQADGGALPACEIYDYPRMAYRGMMLDLVRCYLPIEEVKKMIDIASRMKINKAHLHLTDDNGWRMEVKQYPRLTEVGAWRVDRPQLFPGRPNPKPGEPATYGGYYTQDQLRDLVDYAARRNVEIIPEIEMPAHAVAAIASYPWLACPSDEEYVGVLTGIGGKAASIIMCAGNDSTLQFVTNVLDEVMDIFPSKHIHLGGDEANKSHWEKCEKCNARIAELGLDGYEELQAWFMDSINSYVRRHGRTAIGWDEVTYGNPKEDIVIMGWQGDGSIAVDYAKRTGRRFVMTPAQSAYFIRYQGPQWFEPFTYFGNITLKDVYGFDPVKADWTPELEDQLWGIQGSMWTEFCRTPQDVQRQVFPRMLALADAAWRPKGQEDYAAFVKALDAFLLRLDEAGIMWAKSMYNVQHEARPNGDGTVSIAAECVRPDAVIYSNGAQYSQPIVVDGDQLLFIKAVAPGGVEGETLRLDVKFNKATGLKVASDNCNNALHDVLTNGIRGSYRNSDFEWASWHNRQAVFEVDLGKEQPISSVAIGVLANANMNAALPAQARLYLAGDDGNYRLAKTIEIAEDKRFPLEPEVTDILFDGLDATARRIKIEADNGGRIPDGYPREDNATFIYIDELIVK